MNEHLDLSLDVDFQSLLDSGLVWYPWVGSDYKQSRNKLLVVGESHYTGEENAEKAKQSVDNIIGHKGYTRDVIAECPLGKKWGNRFFDNIPKALVGSEEVLAENLWSQLAFYNFVQRPMEYRYKERPSAEDFFSGWRVFLEVVSVLRPDVCVFVGVAASNSFNRAMSDLGISHTRLKWGDRLNNIYLRTSVEVEYEGMKTKIVFIKHASSYFSWADWHAYLEKQIPNSIADLKGLAKATQAPPPQNKPVPVERQETLGLPTWLSHKPIVACKYEDAEVKYISVGKAQYNKDCGSVKIWRHSGSRWSRQSEEVPFERICDFMKLFLSSLRIVQAQENRGESVQTSLGEEVISSDDLSFIRGLIDRHKRKLSGDLEELKNLLDSIDLEHF